MSMNADGSTTGGMNVGFAGRKGLSFRKGDIGEPRAEDGSSPSPTRDRPITPGHKQRTFEHETARAGAAPPRRTRSLKRHGLKLTGFAEVRGPGRGGYAGGCAGGGEGGRLGRGQGGAQGEDGDDGVHGGVRRRECDAGAGAVAFIGLTGCGASGRRTLLSAQVCCPDGQSTEHGGHGGREAVQGSF